MCHVLVIEDDWLIGEEIEWIARCNGAVSVDRAETEALAIAAALSHVPDVIFSDVRLSEGTGPQAVTQIMYQLGPMPVIFITATPDACEPCDYAAAILHKPASSTEIATIFRSVAPA